jgi:hypothetical protein
MPSDSETTVGHAFPLPRYGRGKKLSNYALNAARLRIVAFFYSVNLCKRVLVFSMRPARSLLSF